MKDLKQKCINKEEEKQQPKRNRRSRFDIKPEQKQEKFKKKAAIKCGDDDERFITLNANNIGPYRRRKEPAECNDEELIESYCENLMYGPIDMEAALKEAPTLRKYLIQVEASQGFDIDDCPDLRYIPMCAPYPAQRSLQRDEHYLMLARFALENYNQNNGTKFQVDELVQVNGCHSDYYLITFKVKNPSNTFQAKVNQKHVSVCRPKPNAQ